MSEAKEKAENNKFTIENMNYSLATVLKNVNDCKYAKVDLVKKHSYEGFIHSVDPVTISLSSTRKKKNSNVFTKTTLNNNNVIMSVPWEGEVYKTVIIPGHAIVEISFRERPAGIIPPEKKKSLTESKQDIFKRKSRLLSWFKTNLLPVTELDDKIVIGNVTLLQPYKISDISTDNSIIAMRIKNIIEKMPEDFEA